MTKEAREVDPLGILEEAEDIEIKKRLTRGLYKNFKDQFCVSIKEKDGEQFIQKALEGYFLTAEEFLILKRIYKISKAHNDLVISKAFEKLGIFDKIEG